MIAVQMCITSLTYLSYFKMYVNDIFFTHSNVADQITVHVK